MDRSDRLERASTLLGMERPEAAEVLIREHLVHEPDDTNGWQLLSQACYEQERFGEAIEAANKSIALAPNDDTAYHHLGRAQMRNGGHALAMDAARQAIALDPNNPRNHALLARALHLLDRDKEALKAAQAGLALAPDDAELLQLSGYAMIHSGRTKEARSVKDKVLRADPGGSASHHMSAAVALHSARYKEAEKHYREALRLAPGSAHAREGLLEVLRARFLPYRAWQFLALYQARSSRLIFIAWILGWVVLTAMAGSIPVVGEYLSVGLIILLLFFIVVLRLGHIFAPMADAFILLRPFGASLLGRMERVRAFLAGACIVLCLIYLVAFFITRRDELVILAPCWFAMLVLVSWLGTAGRPRLDLIHAWITGAFAVLAIIASIGLPCGGSFGNVGAVCAIALVSGFGGYFWLRPWVFP